VNVTCLSVCVAEGCLLVTTQKHTTWRMEVPSPPHRMWR